MDYQHIEYSTINIDEHFQPMCKGPTNKLICRACKNWVLDLQEAKIHHITKKCRRIAYEKLKYRLKYLPNYTVEMVCEVCNWKRKANPNNCLMHRRTCDGFGNEDYSSLYDFCGFENIRLIIEHIRGNQTKLSDVANKTLLTDNAEDPQNGSVEVTERIDLVEIQIDTSGIANQTNDSSRISAEISRNVDLSQQVPDEHQQTCQMQAVDLITVYTRPEAADSICICFMCGETSNRPHFNLKTSRTKYTRQRLVQMLGIFLDLESNIINESNKICGKCLKLINKYDLATETANKIKLMIQQRITGEIDVASEESTNNSNDEECAADSIDISDDEIEISDDEIEISDDEIVKNRNEEENIIDVPDDDDDSGGIAVQYS